MKRQRQKGLALITVLLVMALLTLLVAGMLHSHRLLLGGVAQQLDATRLLRLAQAGEQQALASLRGEVGEILQVTHGRQGWGQPRVLTLGEGRVQLQLEDLAGRFNLGALTAGKTPDPLLIERWQRLCHALQVAPPALEALAGQPLLDPTQLRALPGVTAEVMARLQPWVVVLPKEARLNINTAPARLLAALAELSPAVAADLIRQRPEAGYPTVERFLASAQLEGVGVNRRGLAVTSRWFRLEVQAQQAGRRMYLYSDLEIDLNTHQVRVVRRVFTAMRERRADE
ncbi:MULTISPECIES: general secretion pathway protein GspK [Pseudomonas]|uniref:Type II secretion system protein K n=1 Tax=Pseudomonas juntendi TaxID=2666183 RepID=A0A7W2KFZ2_9PSED|nr:MULTISPECIES: type II secretion system protein GspK [Pseudomonas]MBA6097804.1 general secretion pathway protein GspK [Pseudomonas juntendi]